MPKSREMTIMKRLISLTLLLLSNHALAQDSEKETFFNSVDKVSVTVASILRDYDQSISEKCRRNAPLTLLQNASSDPAFNDMVSAWKTGQDEDYRKARSQVRCS